MRTWCFAAPHTLIDAKFDARQSRLPRNPCVCLLSGWGLWGVCVCCLGAFGLWGGGAWGGVSFPRVSFFMSFTFIEVGLEGSVRPRQAAGQATTAPGGR